MDRMILETLRKEYAEGKTQAEIAREHRVTQTYIQCLLSGKRSADGMTLNTLKKMFPSARLDLHPGSGGSQVMQNVVGDGNRQVMNAPGARNDDMRRKMMDAVIALDIPDDARTKVLRALLDL